MSHSYSYWTIVTKLFAKIYHEGLLAQFPVEPSFLSKAPQEPSLTQVPVATLTSH